MRCPYCNSPELNVIKTENSLNAKLRKRNCNKCNMSFMTIESVLKKESYYELKKEEIYLKKKSERSGT
jgi:transcriptional regulator NrdR family protein